MYAYVKDASHNAVLLGESECCPGVVDPLTLLTILAAIAGATLLLRQLAIDNITGRKKRSVFFDWFNFDFFKGRPNAQSYFGSRNGESQARFFCCNPSEKSRKFS